MEQPVQVRRRARGDRTRAALVDAALERFAVRGVEATSIDEITSLAAVAKGTFYVHFQRKEDVLLELGARLTSRLPIADDAAAPADALRALAARLAEAVDDGTARHLHGRVVREIVGHREDWLRVLAGRATLASLAQDIIGRGQRQGLVRADVSDRRLAQGLSILWLDTIIGWSERVEHRPLADELALATELFLGGALA